MDTGTLPVWLQSAAPLAIALFASIIGVIQYFKTEAKKEGEPAPGTSSVISASFIDSKLLRELIDVMRDTQQELGRDAKKGHALSRDLREAVNELNESIIVQTDTTMNLVRFVNRRNNQELNQGNT